MKFTATPLAGAFLIDLEPRQDERGFFSRVFCQREFSDHGLVSHFVQINDSLSTAPGTLRGMHYQLGPSAEVKLVRCLAGALFDVIVDLRPDSPTFLGWFGAELSAANRRMMYVPQGFAHGFLTLAPHTEAFYLVSTFYDAAAERGLRFDDPRIGVCWPAPVQVISAKDRAHPDFDPEYHLSPPRQK